MNPVRDDGVAFLIFDWCGWSACGMECERIVVLVDSGIAVSGYLLLQHALCGVQISCDDPASDG